MEEENLKAFICKSNLKHMSKNVTHNTGQEKNGFFALTRNFLRYSRQNSSLNTMACKNIFYSIQFFQNVVINMSKRPFRAIFKWLQL